MKKYIVSYGVDLSHLHETCVVNTLKAAKGVACCVYLEGSSFSISSIEEGSSHAENLWNSKQQKALDNIRAKNNYRAKKGYALLSENSCRFSLFNGETKKELNERMKDEG